MATTESYMARIVVGTAAELAAAAPVLDKGEFAIESDTKVVRIGDGSTAFASLSTFVPGARRGTAAALAAVVLPSGQFGYETDTKILRLGDGATAFATLPALVDLT